MILIFLFVCLMLLLFIGAVTAVFIRADVLKQAHKIVDSYEHGLLSGSEARKALTNLKQKMITKPHKDEVQDLINLIV